MSAVTVSGVSSAEDAFERARRTVEPVAPVARVAPATQVTQVTQPRASSASGSTSAPTSTSTTASASASTTTHRARPRARLLGAPPPALAPVASGPAHPLAPTIGARISALRASERATPVDPDEDRPGPTPSTDPAAVACTIALACLEVLAGRRPVAQLARWLAPGVFEALQVRTALTTRVLAERRSDRPPVVRRVRAVPAGRGHEVSVVAADATRVRAVALRLEAHRGAWRATALEIG